MNQLYRTADGHGGCRPHPLGHETERGGHGAYCQGMDDAEVRRRFGQVFDGVAEEYDRARRGYPDELVQAALRRGRLAPGDPVLEVGCGTGLLTAALAASGLRVEAVDPGANMLRMAARRVGETSAVRFHLGKFEDRRFPEGAFAAVFSATAFHWVEPALGWAKAASVLRPRGVLALIQHCGVWDEPTSATSEELLAALREVAPDVAAGMPPPRDTDTVLAGVAERQGNVSEVWSWIGQRELAVTEAAALFDDVQISTVPLLSEQTAEELNALVRTTSLYAMIAPDRRGRLEAATYRIADRFGGTIRLSELAVLVSARRATIT